MEYFIINANRYLLFSKWNKQSNLIKDQSLPTYLKCRDKYCSVFFFVNSVSQIDIRLNDNFCCENESHYNKKGRGCG